MAVAAVLLAACSGGRGDAARSPASQSRHVASAPSLTSESNPDGLPSDCIPNAQGPPFVPYELGFVGTVTHGSLHAGVATVQGITAKVCGIVTVVGASGQCPAVGVLSANSDDQKFAPLNADLNVVPGFKPGVPFSVVPGKTTGGFVCTPSSQQGLAVTLKAVVGGSTGLFGLRCGIGPVPVQLTGIVTGPLTDVTGTFTGHNFAVPAVGPSPACSQQVASNLNALAGLPIASGGASITLELSGSLYQPS